MIERCLVSDEIKECVQEEAANTMEAALNLDVISLIPGVSLQRDYKPTETPKSLATYRSEHTSAYDRFWQSFSDLINSHSIAINMTELQEEGRGGKKKKVLKYIVVALITVAIVLIPIKLKLIAWVAASALLIGKLALLLASLVGLKILVSKPHEETTYLHYDSHRSDPAHYLAYSGYDLPPGNSIDYN
ncbi:hypothetical protein O3M35_005455 [Rhynocoris fuscipes]|uniref:Uncharacterized protein n=1 Tax=Rhynocoris fuscipes TaxID=488301 RepID=A0AAW1DNM3_9HEMI